MNRLMDGRNNNVGDRVFRERFIREFEKEVNRLKWQFEIVGIRVSFDTCKALFGNCINPPYGFILGVPVFIGIDSENMRRGVEILVDDSGYEYMVNKLRQEANNFERSAFMGMDFKNILRYNGNCSWEVNWSTWSSGNMEENH